MTKNKQSGFLFGAGMFAICSIVAKAAGALYRIPLMRIATAEGMGIYQTVFSLYIVLLTLASGGVSVSVARLTAQRTEKNQSTAIVLLAAIIPLSIIGTLGGGIILLFCRQIAQIQGNATAYVAYIAIAPSVLLAALVTAFRGYFQGKTNLLPESLSMIVEQIVKFALGIALAFNFARFGAAYAVMGALIGISLSELAALALMLIALGITSIKKRAPTLAQTPAATFETALDFDISRIEYPQTSVDHSTPQAPQSLFALIKELYKIALPVLFGALIMPVVQLIDSGIVVNMLTSQQIPRATATAQFGILNGAVSSIINLPAVVTMSLAIVLLPKAARSAANQKPPISEFNSAFYGAVFLSLPAVAALLIFPKQILSFLFGAGLTDFELSCGSTLLSISAISVFYLSVLQVCTALLQGIGKPRLPALSLLIAAITKVILTIILLKFFGIYGVAFSTAMCFLIAAILDFIFVKIHCGIKLNARFLAAAALSLTAFSLSAYLSHPFFSRLLGTNAALIAALSFSFFLYSAIFSSLNAIKLSYFT